MLPGGRSVYGLEDSVSHLYAWRLGDVPPGSCQGSQWHNTSIILRTPQTQDGGQSSSCISCWQVDPLTGPQLAFSQAPRRDLVSVAAPAQMDGHGEWGAGSGWVWGLHPGASGVGGRGLCSSWHSNGAAQVCWSLCPQVPGGQAAGWVWGTPLTSLHSQPGGLTVASQELAHRL